MGEWFTAFVLDVVRGWIGSSEGGEPKRMSEAQIAAYQEMQDRHAREEREFLREAFHAP